MYFPLSAARINATRGQPTQHLDSLLLTAYPESADVARARELGVLGVFRKAEDFTPLLDEVDRVAPHHRASNTPPEAGASVAFPYH